MNENHNNHVLGITGKLSNILGEEGTKRMLESPAHSKEFQDAVNDIVSRAGYDYYSDLTAKKVSKKISEDIAQEVVDKTQLAYDNWRWWANAAATGVIGAVTVFGIAATASYIGGRGRSKPSSSPSNDISTDPFAGTDFKASPRPSMRPVGPQDNMLN